MENYRTGNERRGSRARNRVEGGLSERKITFPSSITEIDARDAHPSGRDGRGRNPCARVAPYRPMMHGMFPSPDEYES
jgi:hypothetical protein